MSLNEPNSAERNEAFYTHLGDTDPSCGVRVNENAEVILRLPDLDQMDAEPEDAGPKEAEPEEIDARPAVRASMHRKTKRTSRSKFSKFFSSRLGKDQARTISGIAAMLLLAGIVGFGAARVTDGLGWFSSGSSGLTYDCPAPDAPEAPPWQAPAYASDRSTPESSPSFDLPVNLATSSQKRPSESFSTETSVAEIAPSTNLASAPSQQVVTASTPAPHTAIPVGPNVTRPQVFDRPVQGNSYPAPQVTEADRFSPGRIQEVMRNQQGAVQAVNYPQSVATGNSTTSYPQPTIPIVAQRPNQQRPQYPPAAPAAIPPVSPYPPSGYVYPTKQYTTPQHLTSQNWPGQQTSMTPSTPQPRQPPIYPSTGYSAPSTAAQPPAYQGPVYR